MRLRIDASPYPKQSPLFSNPPYSNMPEIPVC
jgi:hypothetical protein